MKVYLVQVCEVPLNDITVYSVHRTLEGAVEEMKRRGLDLMRDRGLIIIDKTACRIVLGCPGYLYTDVVETVELYVHEMELQE